MVSNWLLRLLILSKFIIYNRWHIRHRKPCQLPVKLLLLYIVSRLRFEAPTSHTAWPRVRKAHVLRHGGGGHSAEAVTRQELSYKPTNHQCFPYVLISSTSKTSDTFVKCYIILTTTSLPDVTITHAIAVMLYCRIVFTDSHAELPLLFVCKTYRSTHTHTPTTVFHCNPYIHYY